MSFEKMNRILEFDEGKHDDYQIEPGVITGEIQKLADRHNLVYGGDPAAAKAPRSGQRCGKCRWKQSHEIWTDGIPCLRRLVVVPSGEVTYFGGKD